MNKRDNDEDDAQASKKARLFDDDANNNAIPIFLRKTYKMIDACNPEICSWSDDGEMFIVKQPDIFASEIIPQYFDHSKFSSFARQLNFYGFRKIQTKPIRNEDFDKSTAKHVTFYNDKFKRGRQDLLKDIQRSTRGGGNNASLADQAKEIDSLRATVAELERRILDMEHRWQDMAVRLDREIQTKTELVVMELMGGRQTSLSHVPSLGEAALLQRAERSFGASHGRNMNGAGGAWGAPLLGSQAARAFSTASASSMGNNGPSHGVGTVTSADPSSMVGATLPPHPKQKSTLPPPPAAAPDMGGFIQVPNHGGINPGASLAGSFALRNAWEDKFFSTLMMQDGASRAASLAGLGNNMSGLAALAAAQQQQQAAVALRHASIGNGLMSTSIGNSAPGAKPGHFMGRQSTADILLEAAGEVNKKSEASQRSAV